LLELYEGRLGKDIPNIASPELLEGEEVYEIKEILDKRISKGKISYLVK